MPEYTIYRVSARKPSASVDTAVATINAESAVAALEEWAARCDIRSFSVDATDAGQKVWLCPESAQFFYYAYRDSLVDLLAGEVALVEPWSDETDPVPADALHARLGLRPLAAFRRIWGDPPDGWHDLGEVEVEPNEDGHVWARVRVEVTYTPATFWRFTIDPAVPDVQAVELTTGSGDLEDYWPMIEQFAGGMAHARVVSRLAAIVREP